MPNFSPLSKQDEVGLLLEDALSHFLLSSEETACVRDAIIVDIPIAAKRFLSNGNISEKEYKFSAYFSWYILQRLDAIDGLKRKEHS
jgi:hypothetical protein